MPTIPTLCLECNAPLSPAETQGLCARCLLRLGLSTRNEDGSSAVGAGGRVQYFGNYELIEEVGIGGMGIVWRARQTSLDRIVALKMIRGGMLADEDDVKRFRAEAQAAANLQHPNIVAIHEIGEHEGQHYYSMDFVEGQSLHDLCDGKPLAPERSAKLLATIAEAVEFAHRAQILHRDLKPQNVMIDAAGVPRLTDFGLAKRMDLDSGLTQTGAILGSPSYMAPEQAQGRNDVVGPRTDVYSLGAILYETLTGRPPFQAASALDTVRQVVDAEPAPPRRVNPSAPADLETICLKCLEKDPARRYASAQEFSDELGRFLRHEPIHARPIGIIGRTVKWARRKPAIASLVLGNAAAMVAIVVGQFFANVKLQKSYDRLDEAEAAAKDELAWSRLRQAKVIRASDQPGRREQALSLLQSAAELEARPRSAHTPSKQALPSRAELRTEAVAALLVQDATVAREVRVTILPGSASLDRDGRRALGFWMSSVDMQRLMKGDTKGMKGGLALQDLAEGREVARFEDPSVLVSRALAVLSPDGTVFASAHADAPQSGDCIILRDATTNAVRTRLAWPVAGEKVERLDAPAFSRDGKWLAAVRREKAEVAVWEVATGAGRVVGRANGVLPAPAFTPDAAHVVFKTGPQTIERHTLADGRRFEIMLPAPSTGGATMAQSGAEFVIATGVAGRPGGALLGVDWNTGAQTFSLPLAHEPMGAAAFGPDRRIAFSDGPDIMIYDIATGRVTLRLPDAHSLRTSQIAWGSEAKFFTSIGGDGTAKRWELLEEPLHAVWRATHDHRSVLVFSADGKWAACVKPGHVVVQSRGTAQPFVARELPLKSKTDGPVPKIVFSADSAKVAAVFGFAAVVWDGATGAEIQRVLPPPHAYVKDLAFDAAGHLIVSHASADGCSLQDATTGKVLWQSAGEKTRSVAMLSADARRAIVLTDVSGFILSDKKSPRLIDVSSGRVIAELKRPGMYVPNSTEISPDGREACLLSSDALAMLGEGNLDVGPGVQPNAAPKLTNAASTVLWSLAEPERTREGLTALRAVFSHDGKWLACAEGSGSVVLRDRATLAELFRWRVSDTLLAQLTLAPGDSILVVGDGKTALQTLDLAALRRGLAKLGLDW